ncbi:ATPase, AAA family [Treponema vincentii ATCC 35580]|uniref:Replication-associated recombination protein A n=1 Tax=Treponema vincentii ATCC 35580 TaxID=596324 RepID=C8PP70_9SPIR|nr:AAA family ATPase [Treponema vincentii]EEV20642.1 ATPase, AAA family [Treponema vincentii ATCC 35580]
MSKDLFETAAAAERLPLAARMRPRSLDEYIGQEHIVGKGRLLRRAIQADRLSSVIFFGPPGTGKTTLAQVIANHTKSNFLSLNAVLAGVQQIRDAIASAEQYKKLYGKPTILFVDEVHRWNRAQQDALLPWVENGTVIFIGATTENPFFEVNKALVSRSRVFQLKALTDADLYRTAERCLRDTERGYGKWKVSFTDGALEHLIETAAGDARSLLNALELAVETSVEHWPPPAGTEITIDMQAAEESIQQKAVLYDKDGDYHYDIISAFIKSIRGSDPDAALYWLARMVRAGESPHFIFRRMLISACEDIGLADPHALTVVTSAAAAFDRIGLPEGRYHLTHAALYLATCPKSNSSLGFFDALKAVEKEQTEVPNHLKDANRDGESLGHGEGYLYPHAYRDHWIAQQYLPDELIGRVFYTPGYTGYEEKIRNDVLAKRETQLAAIYEAAEGNKDSFTVEDWQARTEGSSAEILEQIRDTLMGLANLSADDRVLIYRADGGLLLWPSTRITLNGCTAGIFEHQEALQSALRYAETFEFLNRPITAVLPSPNRHMETSSNMVPAGSMVNAEKKGCELFPDLAFDAVLSYNPAATADDFSAFFSRIAQEHTAGTRIIFAFALPQQGLRLSALLPPDDAAEQSVNRFTAAETAFFSDSKNKRIAWTEHTVAELAEKAGYRVQLLKKIDYQEKRLITQAELNRWFSAESEYGTAIRSAFAADEAELEKIIRQLEQRCRKPAAYTRTIVYMSVSREIV